MRLCICQCFFIFSACLQIQEEHFQVTDYFFFGQILMPSTKATEYYKLNPLLVRLQSFKAFGYFLIEETALMRARNRNIIFVFFVYIVPTLSRVLSRLLSFLLSFWLSRNFYL